jgi:epsin
MILQDNVDLFAGNTTIASAFPPQTGFIPPPSSGASSVANSFVSKKTAPEPFDPFGDIPLSSFGGSDPFGDFSSNVGASAPPPGHSSAGNISTPSQNLQAASDFGAFESNTEQAAKDPFDFSSSVNIGKANATPLAASKTDASDFGAFVANTAEAAKDPFDLSSSISHGRTGQTPLAAPKSNTKKENIQVKSSIWADSLSRGLIDLNITGRTFLLLFISSFPVLAA